MGGSVSTEFRRDLIRRWHESGEGNPPRILDVLESFPVPKSVSMDLSHIPTLYRLDRDKDGGVSQGDLLAFAEFACSLDCAVQKLGKVLKCACTVEFVDTIKTEPVAVTEWVIRVCDSANTTEIPRESIVTIFGFLKPGARDEEFALFWKALASGSNDAVPRSLVADFVRKYLNTYADLFLQAARFAQRRPA